MKPLIPFGNRDKRSGFAYPKLLLNSTVALVLALCLALHKNL